ncbi:MAG: 30S ribosomal protein S21 [Cytophagales bacterium]|jgi:small subunit ribosomal protein S21
MIIIHIKDGEMIERSLKRFKKKFEKIGILKALRQRMYYRKKSVIKRQQLLKAIYKEKFYPKN